MATPSPQQLAPFPSGSSDVGIGGLLAIPAGIALMVWGPIEAARNGVSYFQQLGDVPLWIWIVALIGLAIEILPVMGKSERGS